MQIDYLSLVLVVGLGHITLIASSPNCNWLGESPFCGHPQCSFGWHQADRNKYGDGHRCLTGKKVLCCEDELPTTTTIPTTTRRPETIRPSLGTTPYPRPTPPPVPSAPYPDDDGPSGDPYGWRGKNVVPIPITIQKPVVVTPNPVTRTTPKPQGTNTIREKAILDLLSSLDDFK